MPCPQCIPKIKIFHVVTGGRGGRGRGENRYYPGPARSGPHSGGGRYNKNGADDADIEDGDQDEPNYNAR